jgi:DNA-binding transcriptional LysR family regulator
MHRTLDTPSAREIEAIQAVARHGTIRAAAEALTLSPHTIDAHLDSLRHRSGLRYLPQLVAWAAHNGWLADLETGRSDPGPAATGRV